MNAVLQAAQAEKQQREIQLAEYQAEHAQAIENLDQIIELAGGLNGNGDNGQVKPPPETPAETPAPKPKPAEATPATPKKPAPTGDLGKDAVLKAIADHNPEPVSSKVIREATGIDDRQALKGLLDELVEEGQVVKSGQRAGTKYAIAMKQHSTPAAKPTPKPKPKPKAKEEESDPEELSLEEQVLNLLKVERRSHGQLVMNTDGTSGEIRALMNQLRGTGAVLLRRIGQTEFWELPE